MLSLVGIVMLFVGNFSKKYLLGDARYQPFFLLFFALFLSTIIMLSARHSPLLLLSWGCSNICLVRLMRHQKNWLAAQAGGKLAARIFFLGWLFLSLGFFLLYLATSQTSIPLLLEAPMNNPLSLGGLFFLLLSAMTQSAIWPFHPWLSSSLNSPTPVSAMMHAGLVSGGVILLIRLAPLYKQVPSLLLLIFILGMITSLLGTTWKLLQPNIKQMLACSTIAQMGFLFVQCGLGLFSAAVTHLFYHGVFKTYLFLSTGSQAQEEKTNLQITPKPFPFCLSLLSGMIALFFFCFAKKQPLFPLNTHLFLQVVIGIFMTQLSISCLKTRPLLTFPLTLVFTSALGLFYGYHLHLIETFLLPTKMDQPMPLHFLHVLGILVFSLSWLLALFRDKIFPLKMHSSWFRFLYVKALNSSQPDRTTVTAFRNHYSQENGHLENARKKRSSLLY